MADPTPWYRTRRGPPLVVGYVVVTLAVVAVSTGWDVGWPAGGTDPSVPVVVYLFGFLGGMTYAFTSLVAEFERGVRGVAKVGLRAVAAMPLAAGVYLLAGPLGLPIDEPRVAAGLSFLVGLYVNVALKALGGLADRLFGRVARERATSGPGEPAVDARRTATDDRGADTGRPEGTGTVADGAGGSRS